MKLLINSCDGVHDSLDVRFTKACDNACDFCIEANGVENLQSASIDKLVSNTISSGINSVLILGGEPFLFPDRLEEYIKKIRPFVKSIYITTSLPKTTISKYTISIFTMVDGINISIQSG